MKFNIKINEKAKNALLKSWNIFFKMGSIFLGFLLITQLWSFISIFAGGFIGVLGFVVTLMAYAVFLDEYYCNGTVFKTLFPLAK